MQAQVGDCGLWGELGRREEERKKGSKERGRVLNHCVLGDYFPLSLSFSLSVSHTHDCRWCTTSFTLLQSLYASVGAQSHCRALFFSTPHSHPPAHPISKPPFHAAHHYHANAITTHQSKWRRYSVQRMLFCQPKLTYPTGMEIDVHTKMGTMVQENPCVSLENNIIVHRSTLIARNTATFFYSETHQWLNIV